MFTNINKKEKTNKQTEKEKKTNKPMLGLT